MDRLGSAILIIFDAIYPIITLLLKPFVTNSTILLQWKSPSAKPDPFYSIERSSNEKEFEISGVIKACDVRTSFEFLDEKPFASKNYYRSKMHLTAGKSCYSKTIIAGMAGVTFCKFYPNPLYYLLIVRSDLNIELKISDAMGR